jgi:probable rRNA maturation factor
MDLVINNSERVRYDKKKFAKIADMVSRKKHIVSLSFVSKAEMKKLNRRYRGKNKPTDVLSFNLNEGRLLGDVLICPDVARANAKEYGTTIGAELARLLAHGLLHLTGYDHGKKMFDLQEKITEACA